MSKWSSPRRALTLGATALATALAVAGCSSAATPTPTASNSAAASPATSAPAEATTVKMVLWPGPEGDAMQKVVDAYNAGQGVTDGIKVDMILLSRDDTFAQETTNIGAQSSEVDIYFTASYNVAFFSPGLEPLTDVTINTSDYFPAAIDGLKVDGVQYALPLDISNHFLYYRKDLIDALLADDAAKATYAEIAQATIGEAREPKSPEEWDIDDFHAAAAYFSKTANPDSPTEFGTALQLKTSPFNITLWDDLLWGVGGSWETDGTATLTSPEATKVTDVYADIYKKGYTSPDSAQAEYAETNAALQSGSAAFALQWSAAYAELTDPTKSPDIADKIAVAPLPGNPHSTHVHALAVSLNKYAENRDAAVTWLSYLATPAAMDAYAKAGGIPSMPAVLSDNVDVNPVFGLISDHVAKYGYSFPIFTGTFDAMTQITESLNPAWVGVSDTASSLEAANTALQELLDK